MRRLALVLVFLAACSSVSEDCAHAAARWNATLGPYIEHGRGEVLDASHQDVVVHRYGVVYRQQLTVFYDECFTDEQVALASAQLAELNERMPPSP